MGEYDVVVVGGGTAGCVVAARLSEDPDASVLLLEAGGDERRPDIEDPGSWADLLGTDADWGFETVVQAATGRRYPAPRGRVLGGSGSINCLAHLRGHPSDFDGWAGMGSPGWDYLSVLPYFKRSEHVPHGDSTYRGSGGPLHPRAPASPHPVGTAFITGAVRAGHREVEDFNGADMIGAGYGEMLVHNGRRESTATAYLRPAMGRPNLTVLTGATVVGLDIRDGRCRGVDYLHAGAARRATSDQVILCGGAVGSPHLLMLSGIGAAAELAALGIVPVVDLPDVGRNLQDHILLGGIRYRAQRQIVSTGMDGATLFVESGGPGTGPDLHLSVMNLDYYLDWQQPAPNSFSFAIGHMRPQSRGRVRLASSDPLAAPYIDPNYVSARADLDKIITGVELVDEIVRTGAYDDWGGTSDTAALLQLGRADLEHAIHEAIGSYFHLAGTCRMGVDDDTVVDPQLCVHGVAGLRVADASIMPTIVSTNTNAVAVMIGEKAAALIRGQAPDVPISSDQFAIGRCHGW